MTRAISFIFTQHSSCTIVEIFCFHEGIPVRVSCDAIHDRFTRIFCKWIYKHTSLACECTEDFRACTCHELNILAPLLKMKSDMFHRVKASSREYVSALEPSWDVKNNLGTKSHAESADLRGMILQTGSSEI